MEDFKVIIWIIIGIVYLLTRRKKTAPEPPGRSRPVVEEHSEESRPAPRTFEELLREIEGMKQPKAEPKPVQEFVDYDDDLSPEEKGLEEITPDYKRDEERINQVYEQAKTQAFNRPSLEETLKLEDTIVRFKQFKGYEKEPKKNVLHAYLEELRDPQGFKKAFIMSEILKPRF